MGISGKYHTDYPEENDIVSCYKHICRIEVVQILCLLRPAQCGERPQCRREPCVQRILILCEMRTAAFRAFLRCVTVNDKLAALITVICRNPVSPPDLTGDTPVLDILQPVQIDLVKTVRNEFQFSGLQRVDCRSVPTIGYLICQKCPSCSSCSTSASDREVLHFGHQLMILDPL